MRSIGFLLILVVTISAISAGSVKVRAQTPDYTIALPSNTLFFDGFEDNECVAASDNVGNTGIPCQWFIEDPCTAATGNGYTTINSSVFFTGGHSMGLKGCKSAASGGQDVRRSIAIPLPASGMVGVSVYFAFSSGYKGSEDATLYFSLEKWNGTHREEFRIGYNPNHDGGSGGWNYYNGKGADARSFLTVTGGGTDVNYGPFDAGTRRANDWVYQKIIANLTKGANSYCTDKANCPGSYYSFTTPDGVYRCGTNGMLNGCNPNIVADTVPASNELGLEMANEIDTGANFIYAFWDMVLVTDETIPNTNPAIPGVTPPGGGGITVGSPTLPIFGYAVIALGLIGATGAFISLKRNRNQK